MTACINKAEHLEARKEIMQWWSDYIDFNCQGYTAPICIHELMNN